jgi:hypothetical protein
LLPAILYKENRDRNYEFWEMDQLKDTYTIRWCCWTVEQEQLILP